MLSVSFIFFLSGVSALIFETLWFRQAGLTFGNSVWASSLVLSSFMAGLALGNGLAARYGHRLRRAILFYAALELVIGVTGLTLVLLLPYLTVIFAALFRPIVSSPLILQPLRFGVAFLLLLAPALAMGATLPTLVKAVGGADSDFGRLLGRLYGWNTLGAVVGAASSEIFWIPLLGIAGSGVVAAGLNLLAATLALALARGRAAGTSPGAAAAVPKSRLPAAALRLLAASFLAGGILLGLEVVWFRTLVLILPNTSQVFAMMLAVVLAGIGVGGLLAAGWLRVQPRAHEGAATLAFASGVLVIGCYAGLAPGFARVAARDSFEPAVALWLSAVLMFPVSIVSGVLFTFLGKRLEEQLGSGLRESGARTAGLLTLANTLGAMLGPLLAGFVLLPRIGLEPSILLLSVGYAGVGLCALKRPVVLPISPRSVALGASAVAFAWAVLFFPTNLLNDLYLGVLKHRFGEREYVVAARIGRTESIIYLRRDWMGEPLFYRLVTDGYSMTGTGLTAQRYMSLFVHLPVALHPHLRNALLISYGVGITAASLTDVEELESIDVVDISRDILEMSSVVFRDPQDHPLRDPRVRVHVEDGRYFLQTTDQKFDLITGEPPPPAFAGVVNLYTQEYFELIYDRLREGGLVSYWLPVNHLRERDTQAIVGAFCAAFERCSLWEGTPADWILLGSRGARPPIPEARFVQQWSDEATAAKLGAIGLERPEQLAALFLADAGYLKEWAREVPPLVDNHPDRAPRLVRWASSPPLVYYALLDAHGSRQRFEKSAFVAATIPPAVREGSLRYFEYGRMAREFLLGRPSRLPIGTLHRVLTRTSLSTLALWLLGTEGDKQAIVARLAERGEDGGQILYHQGLGALAAHDYEEAAALFSRVEAANGAPLRDYLLVYALAMAGRMEEARAAADTMVQGTDGSQMARRYWSFMRETFDIAGPQ